MRPAVFAGVLVLAGLCLAACGDDESEEGAGASCDALADAYCDRIESCAPGLLGIFFGDHETCVERGRLGCELHRDAPDNGYDDAWARGCSSALDDASCDDLFGGGLDACDPPAGSRPDGAACGDDGQCQSAYCDAPGPGCGVCRDRIPAGGSCGDAPQACEPGTGCGFNQQCIVLGRSGDPCDGDQPCISLYACVEGTCTSGAGPGESCGDSAPCDIGQQLFCNGGVCAKFELAGPGEPCGNVGGTAVACAAGECFNGTCAAPGEDGEACGGENGDLCLGPAECDGGTCTVLDPASC